MQGEARGWSTNHVPRFTITLRIDRDAALSGLRSAGDDDPDAAHVGASIRRGCANNKRSLILRWIDHDEIK
ncbi:MAG: hypothetical protein M3354_07895 [Chloroflexota bacterium]|nr:hypothetical protein [Chloroflexota bacterium]